MSLSCPLLKKGTNNLDNQRIKGILSYSLSWHGPGQTKNCQYWLSPLCELNSGDPRGTLFEWI